MPAAFVHRVPDTHRVWHEFVRRLRRDDVVTLSLPGFGCDISAGFDCAKEPFAGCSHWWQLERADEVAKELEAHWR